MGKKIVISGMILLLMLSCIPGCGIGSNEENYSPVSEGNVSNITDSDQSEDESWAFLSFGEVSKEEFVKELKETEISVSSLLVGVTSDYEGSVVDQLNQILEKEGCDFDVVFCRIPNACSYDGNLEAFAQYLKEENVQMDILPVWDFDLRKLVSDDMLTDLTSQIQENDVYDMYPKKYYELTSIDGKNYGLGSCYVDEKCWTVNQELMKKYGFSADNLAKDITQLESVLKTVSDGEQDASFAAFTYQPGTLIDNLPFSFIELSMPVGYWMDDGSDSTQVVNLFDTVRMDELVETMNTYYKKGYAVVSGNLQNETSFFMSPDFNGYPVRRSDSLDTWTNLSEIPLVRIPYFQQDETLLNYVVNAIPSWSEKKDKAWEFLSFINRNEEASTLLLYGIEGEDYTVSDGIAVAGEQLTESTIYNRRLGNAGIALTISPYEDSQKSILQEEELNALTESALKDFVFDETPVSDQVAAVEALYNDSGYLRLLFAFSGDGVHKDWEEYYADYCQQLKDAGIDQIVDEMNRQIQEFLVIKNEG